MGKTLPTWLGLAGLGATDASAAAGPGNDGSLVPVVVRVSKARFAPEQHDAIHRRMKEAEASLAPAIRALPGCIDYCVSVDRASNSMVNISVWDTMEHADAMRTLPEMLALREPFVGMGAQFEPIVNYPTMWRVRSAPR